jgi:hypothetical protein
MSRRPEMPSHTVLIALAFVSRRRERARDSAELHFTLQAHRGPNSGTATETARWKGRLYTAPFISRILRMIDMK